MLNERATIIKGADMKSSFTNNYLSGFTKEAQDVQESEVAPAEETAKASETAVTCLGNCMYAQNPEKKCMLESVSISMGKPGEFACGQYSPTQEQVMPGQAPAAAGEVPADQKSMADTKSSVRGQSKMQ